MPIQELLIASHPACFSPRRNLSHCFAIIIDAVIHLVTYAEVYIGIAIKELRCTFSRERNAVQETARGIRHVANWHSTVGLFPQGEGR